MKLVIRKGAKDEIREAALWYQERDPLLATRFLEDVDAVIASVARSPHRFPVWYEEKRRALLSEFPYSIVYSIRTNAIVIVGCIHWRQNPRRWQRRR